MKIDYDVIIVGAGHAGIEAAIAACRLGQKTLCLTLNLDSVGFMPCNPSIGGPAKGHLVREIDALGGQMGLATDKTLIQLKQLNTSKGPAVRALRAQVDKNAYQQYMLNLLVREENLVVRQMSVERLLFEGSTVIGVHCRGGIDIFSRAVILTTGTYLEARIFIGKDNYDGGPNGQMMSGGISEQLQSLGIQMVRLKTGTPPRINGNTIDFSKTIEQSGDALNSGFSFLKPPITPKMASCWLTYTNTLTHDLIRGNLDVSPLYTGAISGKGPRYCPSIESKITNFPDKDKHQIFVEPEGLSSNEYYVGGFSTSLPMDVQELLLKTIPGLEEAQILRYGYAIEYDSINPYQLSKSLQVKDLAGLFTAGQLNGTSGYEEAAAQGLIAGINASRYIQGEEPFILGRHEAYIGVLIDDLVTKEIDEPYRMLTTRAEYRMLLREGNADERLTAKGYELGVVTEDRYRILEEKKNIISDVMELLKERIITVTDETKESRVCALDYMRRPSTRLEEVYDVNSDGGLAIDIINELETKIKYEGYIIKQLDQVNRLIRNEKRVVGSIDYNDVVGLSNEGREKLSKHTPYTLGQAGRISGVSATDLNTLFLYLVKRDRKSSESRNDH